ncbi:MAG TPA: hypothetical protein DDX92_00900 [Flavobacteriales bacterium]|jgi:hypothetical protein|nr:hypothetical protein [Flavobacteriales bacterium]
MHRQFAQILLFIGITLASINSFGQLLVVGSLNPTEHIIFQGDTLEYDSIIIVNQGRVTISQSQIRTKMLIAVLDDGLFELEESKASLIGTIYGEDNAEIVLKDSLDLKANVIMTNQSSFSIRDATIDYAMIYKGQHDWFSLDSARIEVTNSELDLGTGALSGFANKDASFYLDTVTFNSTLGIAATWNLSENGRIEAHHTGGLELISSNNSYINLSESDDFVLWFRLMDGDTLNYTFPPSNSPFPYASELIQYDFVGGTPGFEGVDFELHATNIQRVYWGILCDSASDVTINQSEIIAAGFIFTDQNETIDDFVNDSLYATYSAPFSDRSFSVAQTRVVAWNFYGFGSAELHLSDNLFGEILALEDTKAIINNSICDGTGGYFGPDQNAEVDVYNSLLFRKFGTAHILNQKGNSILRLHHSQIDGTSSISGKAAFIAFQSTQSDYPILLDQSFYVDAILDSMMVSVHDSIYSITGAIEFANGPAGNRSITGYELGFSRVDSTGYQIIKDSSGIANGSGIVLGNWNVHSLAPDQYLIWLRLFEGTDTILEGTQKVILNIAPGYNTPTAMPIIIYPNPTSGRFRVAGYPSNEKVHFEVCSTIGTIVAEGRASGEENLINLGHLEPGIYFIRFYTSSWSQTEQIVLEL